MLSLTATFADFMPKSLSVLNQIEEVIKTAVNEVRDSASFFKSLPDEEFDVVFCERQGEWWEVHVKVLTPFSRQSWLHKISIDAQVGEAVGTVVHIY